MFIKNHVSITELYPEEYISSTFIFDTKSIEDLLNFINNINI